MTKEEELKYYKRKLKHYEQAIAEFNVIHPEIAYELNGFIIKHLGYDESFKEDD